MTYKQFNTAEEGSIFASVQIVKAVTQTVVLKEKSGTKQSIALVFKVSKCCLSGKKSKRLDAT